MFGAHSFCSQNPTVCNPLFCFQISFPCSLPLLHNLFVYPLHCIECCFVVIYTSLLLTISCLLLHCCLSLCPIRLKLCSFQHLNLFWLCVIAPGSLAPCLDQSSLIPCLDQSSPPCLDQSSALKLSFSAPCSRASRLVSSRKSHCFASSCCVWSSKLRDHWAVNSSV